MIERNWSRTEKAKKKKKVSKVQNWLTESQQMSSSVDSSSTRVHSFVRKAGTADELASITGCDSNIPEDITEPCCCKKVREKLSKKQKCQPFARKHVDRRAHAHCLTTEGTCYKKLFRAKTWLLMLITGPSRSFLNKVCIITLCRFMEKWTRVWRVVDQCDDNDSLRTAKRQRHFIT